MARVIPRDRYIDDQALFALHAKSDCFVSASRGEAWNLPAFDAMLAGKGLKLDGVIEFKVNEGILVERIVKRAQDMEARGEAVRKDDNPEVFKTRLEAYKTQTAPLSAYYAGRGML